MCSDGWCSRGLVVGVALAFSNGNVQVLSVLSYAHRSQTFLRICPWSFTETFAGGGSYGANAARGRSERGPREGLDTDVLLLGFFGRHIYNILGFFSRLTVVDNGNRGEHRVAHSHALYRMVYDHPIHKQRPHARTALLYRSVPFFALDQPKG